MPAYMRCDSRQFLLVSHEREHERKCVNEKKRSLKELEDEELNTLLGDFQARTNYSVLYRKHNLEANSLDKNQKRLSKEYSRIEKLNTRRICSTTICTPIRFSEIA